MTRIILACLILAGCTAAQVQTAQIDGQLFCAIANGPTGALVVGLINAEAPGAIVATGQTAAYVRAACAIAGGLPVSPPADPAGAPHVAVVMK